MDLHSCRSLSQQVQQVRDQVLQSDQLPFEGVLSESVLQKLLEEAGVVWTKCVYTPVTTTLLFLWQCLSADGSCQHAVNKFIARQVALGRKPPSSNTGAYCQARQKLPESVVKGLARHAGHELHRQAKEEWLWKGLTVKLIDGSTVSMPDTKENQEAYPQPSSQKPGLGFPLARILVIFSLAVGTALELAICKSQGKGQSELGMYRQLETTLEPKDVVLADRILCSWFVLGLLVRRGISGVVRLHASRKADFRRGRRLGRNDHIVRWKKSPRPSWMDLETYATFPQDLEVREVRLDLPIKGFRSQRIVVVTTLLDPKQFSRQDLLDLYRQRWQAELDLRNLKVTLQMDVLRCKTPEMVRKELWMHLLAYNLIRTVIAQAAVTHNFIPRHLSFKMTVQLLNTFQPHLETATPEQALQLAKALLQALAQHVVGNRPNRVEPRAVKRRPKAYPRLQKPRPTTASRTTKTPCS